MSQATDTFLSTGQLQELANEPQATLKQLQLVLRSLESGDEETINWACEALENCGSPSTGDLTLLSQGLSNSDPLVATWSCKLIARLGAAARTLEPLLVRTLEQRNDELVKEESARALTKLGSLSGAALQALQNAAASGGPRLKRIVASALTN